MAASARVSSVLRSGRLAAVCGPRHALSVGGAANTARYPTIAWSRAASVDLSPGSAAPEEGRKEQASPSEAATLVAQRAFGALLARGLVDNATHDTDQLAAAIDAVAARDVPSVYVGVDPSADSLHVGNLLPLIAVAHLQRAGLRPVLLVGGATGLIGDPSGRDSERVLLDEEAVGANAQALEAGLRSTRLLRFPEGDAAGSEGYSSDEASGVEPRTYDSQHGPGALVVNNMDWYREMSAVELIRDVGRHFRLSAMLARDSVRARMDSGAGMSFTEFTYSLLQGYDFWQLHQVAGCVAQVGGSDQWGNITAGTDLIGKLAAETGLKSAGGVGITVPLLLTKSGAKFGKSAGNAVWLSPTRTSDVREAPRRAMLCNDCLTHLATQFEFYQFFLNVDDDDVERLLYLFTFVDPEAIERVMEEHRGALEERIAQRLLAAEVTKLVRGSKGLRRAKVATQVLFGGTLDGVTAQDLIAVAEELPGGEMPIDTLLGGSVVDAAVRIGACKSKAEAKRLVKAGGLYVNNARVTSVSQLIAADDLVDGEVLLLRTGRRRQFLVRATAA